VSVLVARDLEVTPPGASEPAVRGASLEVERGEWVALAGPNGGGKTCLLLALAGLWPARGRLELLGRRFGPGADPDLLERVATVLQDPSAQLLHSSVWEEVAFGARNLGVPEETIRQRVDRACHVLGLEPSLTCDPLGLSAGQQQLVPLAAALVMQPEVLLADEPTAHLDAEARRRVLAALEPERKRGLALIWATQDDEELGRADRIVRVGRPAGEEGSPPPARWSSDGPPALRLRVSPASSGVGPRITTDLPLDIEIPERGIVALLGRNGSGKSVLLAAAAGLAPLHQVQVEWRSAPAPPPILTLQFPELQVFEERVADELVFAAMARGVPRERVLAQASQALEALGFEARTYLEARTWSLSNGAKRLIEVVAALVAPANLVLLDEPTAGVDPARRAALAHLVSRRARSGPVLIATQDLDWVQVLGGRSHWIGAEPPGGPPIALHPGSEGSPPAGRRPLGP
jgi:energy-coupling factor transporter ATP-binding protein EcfA2